MKFFSTAAVVAAVATTAFGSFIELGFPKNGANFHSNQEVTVQVVQPETMASCTPVGIAIGLNNCPNNKCPSPSQALGYVLYSGPFTPANHQPNGFYQDITVTLPNGLTKGKSIFSLTHLCLAGAGPAPYLEYRNATVNIV
ncbi:hypothetical protein HYDPIDRAFT_78156 [Hydnomerulius pinastri MD-312]|nr:hypothetical protein HYDPIDRAFT_78156 [Hydnomerulius pinastri MD-312]